MKHLILTASLVLFSTSAFAGSCPMMAQKLDQMIEEVQQLREDAMEAHSSGDHVRSEELFDQAMKLFKNK